MDHLLPFPFQILASPHAVALLHTAVSKKIERIDSVVPHEFRSHGSIEDESAAGIADIVEMYPVEIVRLHDLLGDAADVLLHMFMCRRQVIPFDHEILELIDRIIED